VANSVRLLSATGKSQADFREREGVVGVVTYTDELYPKSNITRPFLNPDFGSAFNQSAVFSGTPVVINDGGDTAAWTGAAGAGSWDFADTTNPDTGLACVSITGANNNDNATFTGASSVNGANYVAITMAVRLETYSPTQNEIEISFSLGGVDKGVLAELGNYLDVSNLNEYQQITIPLEDLGLDQETFDEMTINMVRSGGSKPTVRFDNIQVEEAGGNIDFEIAADGRTILYVECIRIVLVNNVTGNAAKAYNDLLGETLARGILFSRSVNGSRVLGRIFKTALDLQNFGFDQNLLSDDGTNTMLTLEVFFRRPLVLNPGDSLTLTVQDDLTGFLSATALMRGQLEIRSGENA
jgi:hypothetical protein